MTDVGYPDFQPSRDYLSGLQGQQIGGSNAVVGTVAGHLLFTVAAGALLVLRALILNLNVQAAGAAAPASLGAYVHAPNGLDGTVGLDVRILTGAVWATPNGQNTETVSLVTPIAIAGGTLGNQLLLETQLSINTLAGITNYGIYGAYVT